MLVLLIRLEAKSVSLGTWRHELGSKTNLGGVVVKVDLFIEQPGVLMLGMLCALIGSSTWLTIATSIGLPVSTT